MSLYRLIHNYAVISIRYLQKYSNHENLWQVYSDCTRGILISTGKIHLNLTITFNIANYAKRNPELYFASQLHKNEVCI